MLWAMVCSSRWFRIPKEGVGTTVVRYCTTRGVKSPLTVLVPAFTMPAPPLIPCGRYCAMLRNPARRRAPGCTRAVSFALPPPLRGPGAPRKSELERLEEVERVPESDRLRRRRERDLLRRDFRFFAFLLASR